jgi:hypothetical protein
MNERALAAAALAAAERMDADKTIDPTALISDLSHQLEQAHGKIDELETAKRELRIKLLRAEGARDALRELLAEAMK